jgi:hypothetical protein
MKREARRKYMVTLPVYFKEIQNVWKRVAEATGVSERTITRILKRQEQHQGKTLYLEHLARRTTFLSE